MKLEYILLCDSTIREQGTNKLSLIGLFDSIYAQQLPVMHGRVDVVLGLLQDPSEDDGPTLDVTLDILDPEMVTAASLNVKQALSPQVRHFRFQVVVPLVNVQFRQKGPHIFRAKLADQVMQTSMEVTPMPTKPQQ